MRLLNNTLAKGGFTNIRVKKIR